MRLESFHTTHTFTLAFTLNEPKQQISKVTVAACLFMGLQAVTGYLKVSFRNQ